MANCGSCFARGYVSTTAGDEVCPSCHGTGLRAEASALETVAKADALAADLYKALLYLVKVPSRLSGEQLAVAKTALAKATQERAKMNKP